MGTKVKGALVELSNPTEKGVVVDIDGVLLACIVVVSEN